MSQPNSFYKQSGTAIFMALFVVTLVTAISVMWYLQMRTSVRRTQQMIISSQMYLQAEGVVDWAIGILKAGAVNETWPRTVSNIRSDASTVVASGLIEDYQARVNLNSLTDNLVKTGFMRLLAILSPELSQSAAYEITQGIIAWTTPTHLLTPDLTALNAQYLQRQPPYHAAGRSMQSVSELRMIIGMTPELFSLLQSYISALPAKAPMLFTHAPPPILNAFNISQTALPISLSEYFLVRADVKDRGLHLVVYTLLHRKKVNNRNIIDVIWQTFGTV